MGWLIAAAILAALLLLPLGVDAKYDSDGAAAALVIGPFRLTLYPIKKKAEPKNKPAKAKTKSRAETKDKSGGSATDFIPLVKLILKLLADFRTKLRVNVLELNVVLAGGDPCDLAVNYGKACAALGNFWPQLERFLVIKRRDVKVQCNFEGTQTLVTARLMITITLGRILLLSIIHGSKIVKEFLRIYKSRKGGATL